MVAIYKLTSYHRAHRLALDRPCSAIRSTRWEQKQVSVGTKFIQPCIGSQRSATRTLSIALRRSLLYFHPHVVDVGNDRRTCLADSPAQPPSIRGLFASSPFLRCGPVSSAASAPIPYPVMTPSITARPTISLSSSSGTSLPSAWARWMTSRTDSSNDEVRFSEATFCACCDGCSRAGGLSPPTAAPPPTLRR